MQCSTLYQDVKTFLHAFLPEKFNTTNPEHNSTNSCDDEKTSKTVFKIYAESNLEIGIKLSERHSMQIFFENLFVSTKDQMIFTITDPSMRIHAIINVIGIFTR